MPDGQAHSEPSNPGARQARTRRIGFAGLVAALVLFGGLYVAWAVLRGGSDDASPATSLAAMQEEPHVVFQNVRGRVGDGRYAKVALASTDRPAQTRLYTG